MIEYLLKHANDLIGLLAIFGIAVEVTPVRYNPVTKILEYIGKNVNREMLDRINKLESKVDNNEKDRIRHEIFTFANNMRNDKRKYTAEEFQHIFEINEKYRKMGGNGQIKVEMKYIQEKYFELGGR